MSRLPWHKRPQPHLDMWHVARRAIRASRHPLSGLVQQPGMAVVRVQQRESDESGKDFWRTFAGARRGQWFATHEPADDQFAVLLARA
jgi:hypothetical protein